MGKRKISILNLLIREFSDRSADLPSANSPAEGLSQIHRRHFLKGVSKVGVGLTVGGLAISCNQSMTPTPIATVGILGAGIAGLRAAGILSANQVDFRVFEATRLTGGRMLTVYDALGKGSILELGGEFIDSNHTDMLSLVKEHELELVDIDAGIQKKNLVKEVYYFNGRHYREQDVIHEFRKYSDSIWADIKMLNVDKKKLWEKFDRMSITDYLSSKGIEGWLFELLDKAFTAEYGLDSSQQSSLNLLTMLDVSTAKGLRIFGNSDERYKINGGNRLLIDKMTVAIAPSISYDHLCQGISYSDGLYKLEFKGQPTQYCKYLLVAIPFTALRNIELDLDLPASKRRAINELKYGTNSKISFGFSGAVWEDQGKSGYLFSSLIQNGWDSSFVTADESPRTFTVFQGGQQGKDLNVSQASDYLKYLDMLFPGVAEKHNKRVAVFNWLNSSLSKGSYAVYSVGDWTKLAGLESVPVGNMYFAGEHCSENYKGYMNGAAETGRLAAESLLAKINAQ